MVLYYHKTSINNRFACFFSPVIDCSETERDLTESALFFIHTLEVTVLLKDHTQFGKKIRLVRERKGMTLKDVAGKAGVSESLISQIERSRVSPSIETLIAVTDALDIDLEYLFRDFRKTKSVRIVHAEERNTLTLDSVVYEQLSFIPDTQENPSVEAFYITIPPGKEKGDLEFGHTGKELGVIYEGEGDLLYGVEVHKLTTGDTVSFSSDIPHIIRNTGKKDLKAVWIITPGKIFYK